MKFISFIASTMLIVLISQHSMGLPLTSTMLGETCPEGFEMLNGKCMPIQSSTIGVETVTNLTEVITHTLPEEDHVTKVISHTLSAEDQVTEATTYNLPEELHVTEVTTHALPEEVHVTEVTDHTLPVEDHVTEVITHTLPEEDHVTQAISPKTSKQCPAGSEYLENGECGPVEPQVIKKLNDESTTSSILPETATEHEPMVPLEEESTTEVNIPKISKRCPPGSSYLKNGKCGPVKRLAIKTLDDESTTSSILSETATEYEPMVPTEEESTTEVDIPTISERCPPGSSYLKNGKCGPLKRPIAKKSDKKSTVTVEFEPTVLSETTEMIHELTTDLNDEERTGGVDNPQGCPKGTQVDEQGACQEIQGADTEKMTTEPNFPVNQKCPAGYKKLNGRCVYTETKTSSSYLQPKTGDIETSTDEVVPVSDDSTCPDGTAYIASGFCKKLNRPTPANVPVNSEGRCRANYELVDAMCVYKGSKVSSEVGVSASTISMPLHATVDEVQIEVNTDNLFQSTATVTDE